MFAISYTIIYLSLCLYMSLNSTPGKLNSYDFEVSSSWQMVYTAPRHQLSFIICSKISAVEPCCTFLWMVIVLLECRQSWRTKILFGNQQNKVVSEQEFSILICFLVQLSVHVGLHSCHFLYLHLNVVMHTDHLILYYTTAASHGIISAESCMAVNCIIR